MPFPSTSKFSLELGTGGAGLGPRSNTSKACLRSPPLCPHPFLLSTSIFASSLKEQYQPQIQRKTETVTPSTQLPAPATVSLCLSGKEADTREMTGDNGHKALWLQASPRVTFLGLKVPSDCTPVSIGDSLPTPKLKQLSVWFV